MRVERVSQQSMQKEGQPAANEFFQNDLRESVETLRQSGNLGNLLLNKESPEIIQKIANQNDKSTGY